MRTTATVKDLYLDLNRPNKDGLYPVTLQIYLNRNKRYRYTLDIFLTELEFKQAWQNKKINKPSKKLYTELSELHEKAKDIVKDMNPFELDKFKLRMFNIVSVEKNVNYYYAIKIKAYKDKGSISTSNNYYNALNCLLRYHPKEQIKFSDINKNWLEGFENHCVEVEEKSITTVSIYLRTLRTIFNDAISDSTILKESYPFGEKEKKYSIPESENPKKALKISTLKTLWEGEPQTPEQHKAKSFWFFSYACNGMNVKDILNLKHKNIDGDTITFIRAKTAKTKRKKKPIVAYLDENTKAVIEEYGSLRGKANEYIFPVLNSSQSALQQHKAVKNFVRMINQNFKKYAESLGISEKVSTYAARHSFATMAVKKGASMAFVGEAIGHSDTKTTENYFAGFEDETKKEFGKKLFEF